MAGSGYGDCMIGAWCEGRVSPSREGDAEVRRRPTTAAAEDVDGRTRLPSRWRRDRGSAPGRRGKALSWARGAPRSEEHTSELQSLMRISYAVFCLKNKIKRTQQK